VQTSIVGRLTVSALVVATLALAACGGGEDGEKKSTQVAAKVNDDEITVHQVNQGMQRLGNLPEDQVKRAQKQVLDRLVDQQLLVQKAVEQKLDRDPSVVASIEASRRQILAQAYLQKVMGGAAKGSEAEASEFYATHPELFQERRVYRFAQMAIAAQGDQQQAIRAKLEELDKSPDKGRILPQLADWLRQQNIQFRATQNTQAAEQLPLEALPRYHQMKVGDLMFQPSAQGVVVSQLTASQTQPLTEEQAKPFIDQFLQNRERLKLSEDEMKRLREAAKIEYVGEFAKLEQAEPATSEAAPAAAEPAPAAEAAPADSGDQGSVEKGMQGLK
jgi:EpsD family peptidyl-prolyl cis-trans isomerase